MVYDVYLLGASPMDISGIVLYNCICGIIKIDAFFNIYGICLADIFRVDPALQPNIVAIPLLFYNNNICDIPRVYSLQSTAYSVQCPVTGFGIGHRVSP